MSPDFNPVPASSRHSLTAGRGSKTSYCLELGFGLRKTRENLLKGGGEPSLELKNKRGKTEIDLVFPAIEQPPTSRPFEAPFPHVREQDETLHNLAGGQPFVNLGTLIQEPVVDQMVPQTLNHHHELACFEDRARSAVVGEPPSVAILLRMALHASVPGEVGLWSLDLYRQLHHIVEQTVQANEDEVQVREQLGHNGRLGGHHAIARKGRRGYKSLRIEQAVELPHHLSNLDAASGDRGNQTLAIIKVEKAIEVRKIARQSQEPLEIILADRCLRVVPPGDDEHGQARYQPICIQTGENPGMEGAIEASAEVCNIVGGTVFRQNETA